MARFTTFLTYEEPGIAQPPATGGPLRVSWIVPVQNRVSGQSAAADVARQSTEALTTELSAHRSVPTTLAVNPTTAADLATNGGKAGQTALGQLAELTPAAGPDQLLAPSFAPIDLAALSGAGLTAEIPLQVDRGTQILHATSLQPSGGSWVETNANLSNADVGNLTTGLQAAGANQLVVSDAALAPIDNPTGSTFAQPFTLALAHGTHVNAVASDSQVDARFTANPAEPDPGRQPTPGQSLVHPLREPVRPGPAGRGARPPHGLAPVDRLCLDLPGRVGQQPDREPGHPRPAVRPGPGGWQPGPGPRGTSRVDPGWAAAASRPRRPPGSRPIGPS